MKRSSHLLFNLGADAYAWFTAQTAWRESCRQMALQLQDLQPSVIVDLGCGPGVSTFELARQLPDARLVGVDLAPRMLGQARRRRTADLARAPITWIRADAALLPLATSSVDACTGHSFLYLVADRAAVLAEIRRVLRPGGRLALMEPHQRATSARQAVTISRDPRHLLSVGLWRPFSRLHGRFTPTGLMATFAAAGFVKCGTQETLGGMGLLGWAETPA